MTKPFVCRFAVGADGNALTGVWRVWADKRAGLYCGVRTLTGEIKSSIHAPRPPTFPDWERHWGFPLEAKSDVAKSAKADGGPHKLKWTGCSLGPGVSVEWRIVFRGSSLGTVPLPVDDKVTLLPVPAEHQQLEVAVILGPNGPTVGFPREKDNTTRLLAEGSLSDGHHVWVVFVTKDIGALRANDRPKQHVQVPAGKAHLSSDIGDLTEELRSTLTGVQPDGSLAFWDMRARLDTPNEATIDT